MFVHEVMTGDPVNVRPGTHVKEALRLLDSHAITAMPVVDDDGRIVGVVSEADLLRDSIAHDSRSQLIPMAEQSTSLPVTVDEVMSRHPMTVSRNTDLAEAVELMTSTAVKSLPVVDDRHRPVGMVSRRDVVHRLSRSDESIESELDELFRALGVAWSATVDEGRVSVEGPVGGQARALAETAAGTVPGVRSVHVVEAAAHEGP